MSRFIILTLLLPCFTCAQVNLDNITIARDTFGVPHIFSETDAEAAYGLAWAHAEDDFEDIQNSLLAAKNMIARVYGKQKVIFDFAMQWLRIDSLVEANYKSKLSPEFRKITEAYTQGINDYAKAHPKEVLYKKAFPARPHDFVKSYCLGTALWAGLGLSIKAVNEDRIDEFLNISNIGSNGMAVAPSRMEDGKGYLMGNSHQPIEGRFAWYEAHISSKEGWEIIGATFPGAYTIFVGTNPNLGWVHTNNFHNFGDVYELEINPKNKKQYKYDGNWRNFYEKKIKLVVKTIGIPIPITKKVKYCAYGPVWKTKKGTYAFRFPGYMNLLMGEQWFAMNKSKNFDEFKNALSMQGIPLFNVIYADNVGNIFYHSGGQIPKRDPKLSWKVPIKGDTSAYRWSEIVPIDKMPWVINPKCGFVYNANNTPLIASGEGCQWQGSFPGLQRFDYNRSELFYKGLNRHNGTFTEADLDQIKYNSSYNTNGSYKKKFKNLYTLDEAKYPKIADAIQHIKKWNLVGNIENKHAALAMSTHDFLNQRITGPFAIMMVRKQNVAEEDAVWALGKASQLLKKHHGKIDVPLGEVQRHIRGNVSLPIHGLREVPRAAESVYDSKGIYKIKGGDSYIQLVRFSEKGPEIRSINAYGASSHPDSPHFTDQMQLFVDHELKPMTFNKGEVLKHAERVYHPGE